MLSRPDAIGTIAKGSFVNCGPGVNDFQLEFKCSGPACRSLSGFKNVQCDHGPDSDSLSCSNNIICPSGIASFQSNFTFQQNEPDPWNPMYQAEPDNGVQQQQRISLPNCAKYSLTSDGTTENTKIEELGKDEATCPRVQQTPTAGVRLAQETSSSPAERVLLAPTIVSGPHRAASGVRKSVSKLTIFVAFLLGFMTLLPGAHAARVDHAEQLRRRTRTRVRAIVNDVRAFASDFSTDLSTRLTAQSQTGDIVAHNLVADVMSSVCEKQRSGSQAKDFHPAVIEDCVKSVYRAEKPARPAENFLAVFGASLLCDFIVSETYPVAKEYFADGCEGVQDLRQKVVARPDDSLSSVKAPDGTRTAQSVAVFSGSLHSTLPRKGQGLSTLPGLGTARASNTGELSTQEPSPSLPTVLSFSINSAFPAVVSSGEVSTSDTLGLSETESNSQSQISATPPISSAHGSFSPQIPISQTVRASVASKTDPNPTQSTASPAVTSTNVSSPVLSVAALSSVRSSEAASSDSASIISTGTLSARTNAGSKISAGLASTGNLPPNPQDPAAGGSTTRVAVSNAPSNAPGSSEDEPSIQPTPKPDSTSSIMPSRVFPDTSSSTSPLNLPSIPAPGSSSMSIKECSRTSPISQVTSEMSSLPILAASNPTQAGPISGSSDIKQFGTSSLPSVDNLSLYTSSLSFTLQSVVTSSGPLPPLSSTSVASEASFVSKNTESSHSSPSPTLSSMVMISSSFSKFSPSSTPSHINRRPEESEELSNPSAQVTSIVSNTQDSASAVEFRSQTSSTTWSDTRSGQSDSYSSIQTVRTITDVLTFSESSSTTNLVGLTTTISIATFIPPPKSSVEMSSVSLHSQTSILSSSSSPSTLSSSVVASPISTVSAFLSSSSAADSSYALSTRSSIASPSKTVLNPVSPTISAIILNSTESLSAAPSETTPMLDAFDSSLLSRTTSTPVETTPITSDVPSWRSTSLETPSSHRSTVSLHLSSQGFTAGPISTLTILPQSLAASNATADPVLYTTSSPSATASLSGPLRAATISSKLSSTPTKMAIAESPTETQRCQNDAFEYDAVHKKCCPLGMEWNVKLGMCAPKPLRTPLLASPVTTTAIPDGLGTIDQLRVRSSSTAKRQNATSQIRTEATSSTKVDFSSSSQLSSSPSRADTESLPLHNTTLPSPISSSETSPYTSSNTPQSETLTNQVDIRTRDDTPSTSSQPTPEDTTASDTNKQAAATPSPIKTTTSKKTKTHIWLSTIGPSATGRASLENSSGVKVVAERQGVPRYISQGFRGWW